MKTLAAELQSGAVLIADGAWGTALNRRGIEPGMCPEAWNLDRPGDIRAIGEAYLAAGAQVITSNTFGGSPFKLRMYRLDQRTGQINRAGAAIARDIAGPDRHVLGSMGPSGQLLLQGDVTEDSLYAAFREQGTALEEGGADAALIETMSCLDEARIAIAAVRDNTSMEIVCTFTYNALPDGSHRTMMGVTPAEMAAMAVEAGAHIIGVNCSLGPREMVPVVKALREAAPTTPILAAPNAGAPVRQDNGADMFPETPEGMAEAVPELAAAGANIIGGCCGTDERHIRAMADALGQTTAGNT